METEVGYVSRGDVAKHCMASTFLLGTWDRDGAGQALVVRVSAGCGY